MKLVGTRPGEQVIYLVQRRPECSTQSYEDVHCTHGGEGWLHVQLSNHDPNLAAARGQWPVYILANASTHDRARVMRPSGSSFRLGVARFKVTREDWAKRLPDRARTKPLRSCASCKTTLSST
eukprot:1294036-Pleurochrysis_carterae.AAC.2